MILENNSPPPISDTAFFCCGIRQSDAESSFPICNDIYAKRFMTPEGECIYRKYVPNYFERGLNYVRPRIIDNLVAERLMLNPELNIVIIGSGFDSRAYRLAGGNWFEFDDISIISHKNRCLPTEECPNSLTRIPIDYENDNLFEKLRLHDSQAAHLFVIEGVFMYLGINEIKSTLGALVDYKKQHTLICDLMTRFFINTYGIRTKKRFDEMGATIKCQNNNPEGIFSEHGYSMTSDLSVFEAAIHYGALKIPKLFLTKRLKGGYSVKVFQHE